MTFTLVVHHSGEFVDYPRFEYVGGDVDVYQGLDSSEWSRIEMTNIIRDLHYTNFYEIWWKTNEEDFVNVKLVEGDDQAMELALYAEKVVVVQFLYTLIMKS